MVTLLFDISYKIQIKTNKSLENIKYEILFLNCDQWKIKLKLHSQNRKERSMKNIENVLSICVLILDFRYFHSYVLLDCFLLVFCIASMMYYLVLA